MPYDFNIALLKRNNIKSNQIRLYYNDSDFFTFLMILTVTKQTNPIPKGK